MTALTPMSAHAPMIVRLISRSVWMIGMSCGSPVCCEPSDLRARTPSDVVLQDEVARIQIALRTDPAVIADHATAAHAPLDERVLADEDAVADLEGLWMRRDRAAADAHAVAKASATARATPHAASARRVGRRRQARGVTASCSTRRAISNASRPPSASSSSGSRSVGRRRGPPARVRITRARVGDGRATVSTCSRVISGNNRQRQHLARRLFGVRKIARVIPEVRVRRLQVHGNRIVRARLNALLAEHIAKRVAIVGAQRRTRDRRGGSPGRAFGRRTLSWIERGGVPRRRPGAAVRSTPRGGAASRAGSLPGCRPSGS